MTTIKCSCGSDLFLQDVSYIAIERVSVSQDLDKVESHEMVGIRSNVEHLNEYTCDRCGQKYHITTTDTGTRVFDRVL